MSLQSSSCCVLVLVNAQKNVASYTVEVALYVSLSITFLHAELYLGHSYRLCWVELKPHCTMSQGVVASLHKFDVILQIKTLKIQILYKHFTHENMPNIPLRNDNLISGINRSYHFLCSCLYS